MPIPPFSSSPIATFNSRGSNFKPFYNVKEFGAKGDGVTDDRAAILAAIAAVPTAGAEIFFPQGVYVISDTITIKNHGVSLVGLPFASTFADQIQQQPGLLGLSVIKASSSFPTLHTMIQFGELGTNKMWTGGGVYNFILLGTRGRVTPGIGIDILNVQAPRIMNCGLTQVGNAVHVASDQSGGVSNVDVEHNIIYFNTGSGVFMDTGSDENYVRFNYISDPVGYGIQLSGLGNTAVGNHIEFGILAGSGVADGAAIYSNGQRSFIENNDIMTSPSWGIYVSGSHASVVGNHINDVNRSSVTNGSGIGLAGAITDVFVDANNINDNDSNMVYGIYDTTSGGGVTLGINSIAGAVTAPFFSTNGAFQNTFLVGKTGIGSGATVPAAQLHVAASGSTVGMRIDAPQNNGYITAYTNSTLRFGINYLAAGPIEIQTYNNQILALNDQGNNVAIGQTTANSLLDLSGSTTGRASLGIRSGTAPSSPNDGDTWYDGSHLKFRIGGTTYQLDQQGGGTVTTTSVVTANGVSGSVANPTTTPAITLTLGAITPSSIATTGAVSTGNLTLGTAGNKINITTGSNASAGTGTLSGGTVTISTTAVTASSLIFLTDATASLTNVGTLSVTSKSAGVSFTVTSANVLDSSTFNWLIIN